MTQIPWVLRQIQYHWLALKDKIIQQKTTQNKTKNIGQKYTNSTVHKPHLD